MPIPDGYDHGATQRRKAETYFGRQAGLVLDGARVLQILPSTAFTEWTLNERGELVNGLEALDAILTNDQHDQGNTRFLAEELKIDPGTLLERVHAAKRVLEEIKKGNLAAAVLLAAMLIFIGIVVSSGLKG